MSIDDQVRPLVDLEAFALLGGAERDAQLVAVDHEIRRLTVVRASMIHRVATTGSFTDDAHHTPKAWVQAVLNTSDSTARQLVGTAALFHDVPALADAVRAGTVGPDQTELVRQLFGNQRCRAQLPTHGLALIGPAKHLVFEDFRKVVARWKAYADPDGTHRDREASRERRHVRSGTTGHHGVISAEGDAASIEELGDILKAHAESEFLKDCEERSLRYGAEADRHPLRRTAHQRNYDAFVEIFRKAAGTKLAGVPLRRSTSSPPSPSWRTRSASTSGNRRRTPRRTASGCARRNRVRRSTRARWSSPRCSAEFARSS